MVFIYGSGLGFFFRYGFEFWFLNASGCPPKTIAKNHKSKPELKTITKNHNQKYIIQNHDLRPELKNTP